MTIIIDGTVGANKAVVLDSSGKLPAIDASLVTTLNATQVTTGSIATARIDTGTTTGKVLVLDGSGNMPAIAAGSMTGVESATKSASDPTISTNPSTGLGTKWINTTSGEIYILTDATAGENVWTSTGGTSGNVSPFSYAGSSYGYACGGYNGSPNWVNTIDKTSFTSDGNSTDAGNLVMALYQAAGCADGTYGWVAGGYISPYTDMIQKFTFASDSDASDIANLLATILGPGGCNSQDYGYAVGGYVAPAPTDTTIQRWAFVSTANSVSVGDLTLGRDRGGCSSSSTHGFHCGGEISASPYHTNTIDKFSFASGTEDGVDHGDLAYAKTAQAGHSSASYGFQSGGSPGTMNYIERFAYSSNTTATDWADLTTAMVNPCGSSSTTHGYVQGHTAAANTVEKFPYATQTNSSDVGDLTQGRQGATDNVHY